MKSPRALTLVVSVMFFLSGATSLAYEVVWFKRFSHVWGSSSLALAAVVGSFLLGLGLGAFLLGRFADRVRVPLLWYGIAEIVIGLFAFLIPFEIGWLLDNAATFAGAMEGNPSLRYLFRLALTFVVLGPPTMLMGGTLPLLIRQLSGADMQLKIATSWLYGINTLGAAFGTYVAGFHLVPALGMPTSNTIAVSVNLAIGVFAVMAARGLGAVPPPIAAAATTDRATAAGGIGPVRLYASVALAACSALILQVVWARKLALMLGGSTYAFTAMLFVVLVGIGLGSLVFRVWGARRVTQPLLPGIVLLILVGSTAIGFLLIPSLSEWLGEIRHQRASHTYNALVCAWASLLIEFVPSLAMGFLFPMFVDIARSRSGESGALIGRVYLWNTVGTLVGATITATVLFPEFGTNGSAGLALFLACIVTLLLIPKALAPPKQGVILLLLLVQVVVAVRTFKKPPQPMVTDVGMYLYGKSEIELSQLFFREGSSCNVLVDGGDYPIAEGKELRLRRLRVNGKLDASNTKDMKTQLGIAYLPHLLRPEARNVLNIGYGSGSSVGASLQFPIERVVSCEIEPFIFEAATLFEPFNHSPTKDDRLEMVLDDGRLYAQATDEKFDLIVSQLSNPWLVGVSNLFTREFYEIVRDHMTEGGILGQWIQTYEFSEHEYAMVVRTLRSVFPHLSFYQVTKGDTLMLASMAPLEPTRSDLEAAQVLLDASPTALKDFQVHFKTTDVKSVFLEHHLLGNAGLEHFTGRLDSDVINTDYNMRLEFEAAKRVFLEVDNRGLEAFLAESMASEWIVERWLDWGCGAEQVPAILRLSATMRGNGLTEQARAMVQALIDAGADDPRLAAELAE